MLSVLDMTKALRAFRRDDKGVSAVEFGIVAPVFFSMVLGIIEVSRVAYTHSVMKHAIQEVMREIMVDDTITTADMEANTLAKINGLDVANLTINATEVINGNGTDTVTIAATYKFELVVPMVFENDFDISVASQAVQPSS